MTGTVQASRTKKHAPTAIKLPSIIHTPNRVKWERRHFAFRVPVIHYPDPIQSTRLQTPNTLSAAELQKNAMVFIQSESMAAATATVAPTVVPFAFDGREKNWMLGWCGLKPTQEILIPPSVETVTHSQ